MSIAQPDITLLLDLKGVIQRVSLSNEVSGEEGQSWLGRPWIETADEAASDKIRRIVEEARSEGLSAFRQVNQRFPSGRELPIEYTTIRLGGRAGLLAVGRNLQAVAELQSRLIAAQQAMERDYWKLREVETRYRLLFDTSNEAVLLVRAGDLGIVEANPMAIRALGLAPHGRDLLREVAPADREPFQSMLQRVREQGRAPGILVHLGPEQRPWLARATPVVAEPGYVFLLQLSPVGPAPAAAEGELTARLGPMVEQLPDALVLIDRQGIVHWVNRAFLDLVQCPLPRAVLGERLGRWLDRPGADLDVVLAALDRNGTVRGLSSAIRGELGSEVEVEISGALDAEQGGQRLLLVLRELGWRPREVPVERSVDSLPVLDPTPGRAPLQQLVREAVEQLERQYILASLERTGGNRTAAAALLGLSRQSLYAKLERYRLDGGGSGNGGADETG